MYMYSQEPLLFCYSFIIPIFREVFDLIKLIREALLYYPEYNLCDLWNIMKCKYYVFLGGCILSSRNHHKVFVSSSTSV